MTRITTMSLDKPCQRRTHLTHSKEHQVHLHCHESVRQSSHVSPSINNKPSITFHPSTPNRVISIGVVAMLSLLTNVPYSTVPERTEKWIRPRSEPV